MTTEPPQVAADTGPTPAAQTDPFEIGRQAGRESADAQPMTAAQERHVRTLLRQVETQPAKAS